MLTRQEGRAFDLCFRLGPLTYPDLGKRLGICSTSAKNLINRIFYEARKSLLFRKESEGAMVRVGISPLVEKRIVHGRDFLRRDEDVADVRAPG